MNMTIREANAGDVNSVAPLIAKFRVELKSYRGIVARENVDSAREEFFEYIDARFRIYICEADGLCAGFLVCRIESPVVWAEALFVLERYRRKGAASQLFAQAEKLAEANGEDTVYNYVHPNNDAMVAFLRRRGYTVLNLIEIRKKHAGEITAAKIKVGNHEFDY